MLYCEREGFQADVNRVRLSLLIFGSPSNGLNENETLISATVLFRVTSSMYAVFREPSTITISLRASLFTTTAELPEKC